MVANKDLAVKAGQTGHAEMKRAGSRTAFRRFASDPWGSSLFRPSSLLKKVSGTFKAAKNRRFILPARFQTPFSTGC
ncbi:MAG TPA: hypothetical protein VG099_17955 [Gemmataceae bacterium]|nr:hypothetical protein [Gemmataceae bacterium]